MNITLWILQGLLAAAMLMAGGMKATQGKAKLSADPKMAWVEDFSDSSVRGIGALEIAGAAGLILPWGLNIAQVLTPLAALGLAATMVGALMVHVRRNETSAIVPPLMMGIVAIIIAVGRFGNL